MRKLKLSYLSRIMRREKTIMLGKKSDSRKRGPMRMIDSIKEATAVSLQELS